ncbi:MAG: S41 family peptidase [Phycisphaerales bacterium]|nr:S41 family peptidase [Phycisphaerales bacterium]
MSTLTTVLAAAVGLTASILAPNPTSDTNDGLIAELAKQIRDNYVFPKIGQATADHLLAQSRDGVYDGLNDEQLSASLNEELRDFTHDLHFGVRMLPSDWEMSEDAENEDEEESQPLTPEQIAEIRLINAPNGFTHVQRLDGNIGYLEMTGFHQYDMAREDADAAMQLLAGSSALIVDLRKNGGGDPATVQHVSSYLFDPDEPVHLNSLYFRPSDETTEFWTHSEINTQYAMPEVPVYVLTSSYTFSAAEEFSYNLQSLERATIVGETTGGGAHPINRVVVDNRFSVSIPVGRAINPITQTNWEGTGVHPDIAVPANKALDTAIEQILTKLVEQGDENARWGLISLQSQNNPIALSASDLAEYAGQYTDRELMVEDTTLKYRRKGRPSWSSLIALGEDRFVIDGYDGFMMTFERDGSGNITRIVGSYQQGHSDSSDRE